VEGRIEGGEPRQRPLFVQSPMPVAAMRVVPPLARTASREVSSGIRE
jgi:hypothetical protein